MYQRFDVSWGLWKDSQYGYIGTCNECCTVKREYLTDILFGSFSNMEIWRRINLAISNTGISKDWEVFI